MDKKLGLLGIGMAIGLALVLVAWATIRLPYTFQGSLIDPSIPAADFNLPDQFGQDFRLSDQQGHVILIFFGYTNCPDVCPVMLSQFKQVKRQLGAEAEKVKFIFITVDPERDTPERLKKHLANFDPAFLGLTGSPEALEKVWKSYGVYQAKVESGSAAGYLVDHTARVYVIDKKGDWRLTFPFGMETDAILKDVSHLIYE